MTWAAVLTLIVVVVVLVAMIADWLPPDVLLLGGVVVLTVAGVIGPKEAFGGFANTGMLTVAALFVVAAGLRETGAVTLLASRMLGRPSTERGAIARLAMPVALSSSILNNTAVVATLMPAVTDWSRRIGVAPGRLLMPLSFAAILGGTCTLIGTSTNLVVAGLVVDLLPTTPGLHELSMFEITPLGVLVALGGCLALVFLAPVLLPDRRNLLSAGDDPRQYVMELVVSGRLLVGQSVEDAGLRTVPGAYLSELVRDGVTFSSVPPTEVLRANDRLIFVGDVDAMVDLQRLPGLAAAPDQVTKLEGQRQQRTIVKAVVSPRNPLVGRSIRESGFRSRYHAVVIAVARAGERVAGRTGDVVLTGGDVLLLEAHQDFVTAYRRSHDFYMVNSLEGAAPPRIEHAPVALGILVVFMVAVTFDLVTTVNAAFVAAGAMVATRCCTVHEARRSLDLTILIAIASAFGIGNAIASTGLDAVIAKIAISVGATSPIGGLIVVYVVTTLLTNVLTNNAAAVLAVPVAVSLAEQLGVAPMGYVIAVMFAASASFMSPIGYQTNLMVFSAGGYRASDYFRLGLPLTLVGGAITVSVIPWLWPL